MNVDDMDNQERQSYSPKSIDTTEVADFIELQIRRIVGNIHQVSYMAGRLS